MIRLHAAFLLTALLPVGLIAQTATFDTTAEGWTNVTLLWPDPGNPPTELGPGVVQHFTTGGNPGGYLQVTDPDGSQPTGHVQYWKAPASWLGDKSSLYGGELRWDAKMFTSLVSFQHDDILLTGNGTKIAFFANLTPGSTWLTIAAPLTVGSWRVGNRNGPLATQAQILSVLSSLQSIYLRAEFQNNLDTFGIDNAAFVPPASTQSYGLGCGGGILPAPAISATGAPVLGGSYTLQCTSAVASGLGVFVYGLTKFDPGVDLTGLGLTGCGLHASLDVLFAEPIGGGVMQHTLAIPNDVTWSGLHIYSQGVVFAPVNPFGAILSGAIDVRVGE